MLDFGIASATFVGQEVDVGTPAYMAPERSRGLHDHPGSDVFSLGAVGFELLGEGTGSEKNIDPGLADLLAEMMTFGVDSRPSARDVSERARTLAHQLPGMDLRTWAARHVPVLEAQPRRRHIPRVNRR